MQNRATKWALYVLLSAVTVIVAGANAYAQPAGPEQSPVQRILDGATKELGWKCMVLYSEKHSLAVLGAPGLTGQQGVAAFPDATIAKGRNLWLVDYGKASDAAKALTTWRDFRKKQGGCRLADADSGTVTGADQVLMVFGDRHSGVTVYAVAGRYFVMAGQMPDRTRPYDAAEQDRLAGLARKYARTAISHTLKLGGDSIAPPPKRPTPEAPPPADPPKPAAGQWDPPRVTHNTYNLKLEQARQRSIGTVLASETVGPQGGSVAAPQGIHIQVPAGALEKPTRLTIHSMADTWAPMRGNEVKVVGKAYAFGPEGLSFKKLVTVRIPAPAADGQRLHVVYCSEDGRACIPVTCRDGALTFQVAHFSSAGTVTISDEKSLAPRKQRMRLGIEMIRRTLDQTLMGRLVKLGDREKLQAAVNGLDHIVVDPMMDGLSMKTSPPSGWNLGKRVANAYGGTLGLKNDPVTVEATAKHHDYWFAIWHEMLHVIEGTMGDTDITSTAGREWWARYKAHMKPSQIVPWQKIKDSYNERHAQYIDQLYYNVFRPMALIEKRIKAGTYHKNARLSVHKYKGTGLEALWNRAVQQHLNVMIHGQYPGNDDIPRFRPTADMNKWFGIKIPTPVALMTAYIKEYGFKVPGLQQLRIKELPVPEFDRDIDYPVDLSVLSDGLRATALVHKRKAYYARKDDPGGFTDVQFTMHLTLEPEANGGRGGVRLKILGGKMEKKYRSQAHNPLERDNHFACTFQGEMTGPFLVVQKPGTESLFLGLGGVKGQVELKWSRFIRHGRDELARGEIKNGPRKHDFDLRSNPWGKP